VFTNKDKTLFISVYVNDLVITRFSLAAIKALKIAILAAFLVKNLRNINICLRLYIVYNKASRTLSIN
jgi:hypothetical protein